MASWWDNFTNPANVIQKQMSQVPGFTDLWNREWGDVGGLWGDVSSFFTDTSGQLPSSTAGPGASQAPQPDLSSLLQGLLGSQGTSGTATGPAGYTTPDGVFIADGSPEDRYYKLVDAVWTKIFGAHPDFAQARVFHDMGVQNTDQLNQIILQMPSHIKAPDGTPITIGNYEDMLTTGNKFAQQYFGRPVPDSLITQWVSDGLTEPNAIQNWFYSHPAKDIPKDTYGAIWDQANQWTQQMSTRFQ